MHKFHWRRIPGTLTLAITNLIAGLLVFFPGSFEHSLINSIASGIAPGWVYGLVFSVSAAFLFLSIITRRWTHLNIGSAISLFAWTFILVAITLAAVMGMVTLSPIAFALLFWMFAGQATMLFVPLWARGRGYE